MRLLFLLSFFSALALLSHSQCPSGQSPSGNNIVVNGDFSAGRTGFSSQYNYSTGSIYGEGTYTVGVNAASHHPLFTGRDHTSGSGNFMMVNGAGTPNISVWCQTISVDTQTQYLFETWVSSLYAGSPARLQFSINGVLIGQIFTAPVGVNSWVSFNATWNSGTDTVATICIVNQNTATGGNDFGLDDISFRPCRCDFSTAMPADTAVCEGQPVALGAGSGAGSYYWVASSLLICDTCPVALFTPSHTDTLSLFTQLGVCRDTGTVTVRVDPKVSADWSAPLAVCAGQQIVLTDFLQGTSGGVWNGTGVSNDTFFTSGLNGPYLISYSVAQGLCTDSQARTVNVSSGIFIQRTDSLCRGAAYIFPWGGSTDSAGDYEHLYAASGGCDSIVRLRLLLRELPPVQISADKTIFCANDSAKLCAPSGFVSYLWNTGGQQSCEWTRFAGNYYLTVTDANGCTAESNRKAVNVYPVPSVSIIVQGDTLSSFGAVSYQWIRNGVDIPGATSAVYIVSQSGLYSLRITDANGCESTSKQVEMIMSGIPDLLWNEVSLLPNPLSGNQLMVKIPSLMKGIQISIFDNNGRLIQESFLDDELSEIPFDATRGIYFVHFTNQDFRFAMKLVKW